MTRTKQQRANRADGFTLIELMVAMLAGSIVIAGAYYMSDVSSQIFSDQLRRAETQMTLRAATELMRRDIARAGFMSIRDTSEVFGCDSSLIGATGPSATAVAPRPVTAVDVAFNNNRQELILTGNMTTTDQYFVSASPDGSTLALQPLNESYRRSFISPTDGTTFLPSRFMEAFFPNPAAPGPGRMVSVVDLDKVRIMLRDISGAITTTTPPTLLLSTPIPIPTGCVHYDKIVVAPVSVIRYAMQIPGPELSRVGGRTYMTGASATNPNVLHPVLVRSEIDPNLGTAIPGTERVVLDSVKDDVDGFQISAIYDDAAPPAVNLVYTATPQTLVNKGQIRSLIIQLIVESAERIEGDAPHQARVTSGRRALRFEVMLPNAARNSGQF
jgi:prepilin-type N-terminal cleavage/methylation domain-containing protein